MAYEVLPIRTAFSLRSLWRGATKFQVTPVKVLQRTNDFSILEVADSAGARLKIKATRQFVPLFHTAHSSVNFAWKECGRLRFGCQVPTETLTEDLFLLRDQSNIARSACDPHYRPLPEFFEPWAQQWASSEQSTDDLPEPWMEGKFDFSDGQGTHGNRASNPDHLPAQGHQSELPSADGRSDSKASPKLRAGDSVLRAPILPADTIDTTSHVQHNRHPHVLMNMRSNTKTMMNHGPIAKAIFGRDFISTSCHTRIITYPSGLDLVRLHLALSLAMTTIPCLLDHVPLAKMSYFCNQIHVCFPHVMHV